MQLLRPLIIIFAVPIFVTLSNAFCPGYCVMKHSGYWKSQVMQEWNTDVHYFVCRFAEDARSQCGAEWENCVDNYIYVRQIFDAFTLRSPLIAADAGRYGFYGKGCEPFL